MDELYKEKLLNETETAELLGVARQTLANNRFLGRGLPYFKVGKAVRYKMTDIQSFLEAHRVVPEAEAV